MPESEQVIDPVTENKAIVAAYRRLLRAIREHIPQTRKSLGTLRQAFNIARKAHEDQRRQSGEAYIFHPLKVAEYVLTEIKLYDYKAVIAALLHDVIEDNEDYTYDRIKAKFGVEIADIVLSLTKIKQSSKANFRDNRSQNNQIIPDDRRFQNSQVGFEVKDSELSGVNQILLLESIVKDPRIILIKFADRLHNIRTIGNVSKLKKQRILAETKLFYIALAYRLGLYRIKSEFEDIAFENLNKPEFKRLKIYITKTFPQENLILTTFKAELHELLKPLNLQELEIIGRFKNVYSAYAKTQRRNIKVEDIYDFYGIRIIFKADTETEKDLCNRIFETINRHYNDNIRHRHWLDGRDNGYQAIHTTVLFQNHWIEIQIRSHRMHDFAENGLAAHWNYKNIRLGSHDDTNKNMNRWFDNIRRIIKNRGQNEDWNQFATRISKDFFGETITVYTLDNQKIVLPKKATVLDCAFYIDEARALKFIAAKVNHTIKGADARLKHGDFIKILDSDSVEVKSSWLNNVFTEKAIQAIKAHLETQRTKVIQLGREKLQQVLKIHNLPTESGFITHFYKHNFEKEADFLFDLGSRDELPSLNFELNSTPAARQDPSRDQDSTFLVNPQEINLIANCCKPLLGDEIVGIKGNRADEELKIHRINCTAIETILANRKEQLVKAKWQKIAGISETCIGIKGVERRGLIQELTQVINSFNSRAVKIYSLFISLDKSETCFSAILNVRVQNSQTLGSVVNKIKTIEGIDSAARIEDEEHFETQEQFRRELSLMNF